MKRFILAVLLVLSAFGAAFAQTKVVAIPNIDKPAAKPAFPREKFDPTRDPALDLAAAITAAAASGRRIILDVGGEWCGWCVYMDQFFYQNPDITKLRDDNFVWIKVNMSEQNENKAFLAPYPERTGYPHLYVLDADGKLLQSQDTSPLEAKKGYDSNAIVKFLKDWSPPR